jgi:hypothetical protein
MGQSTNLAPHYFVWVAAGVDPILLRSWNLQETEERKDRTFKQKGIKGSKGQNLTWYWEDRCASVEGPFLFEQVYF